MVDLHHLLAIYVHAHQTGNSVPPHIDAEARTALAAEPTLIASEPSDEDLADLAEVFNGDPLPAMRRALELWGRPTISALAAERPAPDPREALAARPLLEAVARLGDCIGQHTVGEIRTISDRAAAWLRGNPPGQSVAIEPRGCPTPGACSCVEPPAPGPTIDDIWEMCEDHGFHLGIDGADEEESAEGLLKIINTALGRWGRPAPAEPVATLHVSDFRGYENYDFQHLVDLPPGHYKLFTACTAQSPAPAPAANAEERDHVPGAGNMVPAAYAARLRQCPTHGQLPANAWGCPECLRELREELAKLKAPAAGAEEREAYAQWLDGRGAMADLGVRNSYFRAAALLRQLAPAPAPAADSEREEREELATFLTKEAVAMDYWFERDTAKKVRRAAALLREARPQPVAAPTPDDFRRWWRETGSDDSGPTPEMLLTANAWASSWAARCAQPIPLPPQGGEPE